MRIRATREMAAGVQNQLQDFIQGEEVLAGPQDIVWQPGADYHS
jgi:hypothetical protein